MDALYSVLAAVIPVVLICLFVYLKDSARPEKPKHLILTFLLGAAFAYPSHLIEQQLALSGWQNSSDFLPYTLYMFFGVAVVIEVLKLLPVLIYPFRRAFFDEPLDGIVYCVYAAMGFVLVKLLLFVGILDWEAMWSKATLSVPAHAVFAMLAGYFLGKASGKAKAERNRNIGLALFWAVVAHGLYEWLVFNPYAEYLRVAAGAGLIVCWLIAIRLITKHAKSSSPTPLADQHP